jgi:hypothetical protein
MDDQATSTPVRCPLCMALVVARRLPEHLEECRAKDHDTRERFE